MGTKVYKSDPNKSSCKSLICTCKPRFPLSLYKSKICWEGGDAKSYCKSIIKGVRFVLPTPPSPNKSEPFIPVPYKSKIWCPNKSDPLQIEDLLGTDLFGRHLTPSVTGEGVRFPKKFGLYTFGAQPIWSRITWHLRWNWRGQRVRVTNLRVVTPIFNPAPLPVENKERGQGYRCKSFCKKICYQRKVIDCFLKSYVISYQY